MSLTGYFLRILAQEQAPQTVKAIQLVGQAANDLGSLIAPNAD